jgi:hypothetical protein
VLAGAVWDSTHVAASAFLPVVASCVIVVTLGPPLTAAATKMLHTSSAD